MEYSNAYLREVLPSESPAETAVPDQVMAELSSLLDDGERTEGDDRFLVLRSTMWTYAAFEQMRLGNYELDLDYFPFPPQHWVGKEAMIGHFGLFDPVFEKPGYGLILDSVWPESFAPTERGLGRVHFRQLGKSFPVIQRHTETVLHAPNSPANCHSACWARDNNSASSWGFMTSGHAVAGAGLGCSIPLSNVGSGILARSQHPPVDAAFVSTPPPNRRELRLLKNLSAIRFPAAGLAVEVETPGGPQPRHVVSVFNSLGVINTSYFGIQVFLDNSCQSGDSGSLIRTAAGDAVALYSGELRGATHNGITNQTLGLGQHFEQALHSLDVSAYV
jgi:hypothetical protein